MCRNYVWILVTSGSSRKTGGGEVHVSGTREERERQRETHTYQVQGQREKQVHARYQGGAYHVLAACHPHTPTPGKKTATLSSMESKARGSSSPWPRHHNVTVPGPANVVICFHFSSIAMFIFEKETQDPKQAPGSELSAQEPDVGLEPTSSKIMT